MRLYVISIALAATPSVAAAQTVSDQLARCAAITLPAIRLQCYDRLAKTKPDSAATGVPGQHGPGVRMIEQWAMNVETDPITDQKGVTFLLQAEGANQIDTPSLIIRCKHGDLDAFVSPDEYLGTGNNRVTIRFGNEPPQEQRWSESGNHTALFHPGGRARVEAFIRSLAQYDRLAIQVRPYQKAPMAMVFVLAGIDQVNNELWAICPSTENGKK